MYTSPSEERNVYFMMCELYLLCLSAASGEKVAIILLPTEIVFWHPQ